MSAVLSVSVGKTKKFPIRSSLSKLHFSLQVFLWLVCCHESFALQTDIRSIVLFHRCSCGRCVAMDEVEDCRCCQEMEVFKQKLIHTGIEPSTVQCFTDHPWYEATCLNPGTLETAYFQFRQQYGSHAVEGDRARYSSDFQINSSFYG